jgi:hypothetical protein
MAPGRQPGRKARIAAQASHSGTNTAAHEKAPRRKELIDAKKAGESPPATKASRLKAEKTARAVPKILLAAEVLDS